MNRMLFYTYYFPPINSPSSKRALDFIVYFAKNGWEIHVITPHHLSNYFDNPIAVDIPMMCSIYKVPPPLIYQLAYKSKSLKSTKENLNKTFSINKWSIKKLGKWLFNKLIDPYILIPDSYVTILPHVVKKLVRNQKTRYDLIFSLGPPLTIHLMGFISKLMTKKPWIALWDDPFTFGPFCESFSSIKNYINRMIEARLVSYCDKMLVTTQETKVGFMKLYPQITNEKIIVCPCYFHKEEFRKIAPQSSDVFRILYTGLLSAKHRSVYAFIEALRAIGKENIEFYIIGKYNPEKEFLNYIEENNISHIVKYLGSNFDRETIISYQKGATVLLLLGWKGGYQIPMKLYEYIGARRPILTIQFDEKDAASKIVKRLKRGVCVKNDVYEIKDTLVKLYKLWRNGKLDEEFDLSENDEFSFENQIKILERTLKELSGVRT